MPVPVPVPVPDRTRRALIAALALASACARPAAEPATRPAEPPPIAAAPSEPLPPSEPTFDGPPSPEVALFLADCRHVVEVYDDDRGMSVPECDALPFDQMCTHDPSGCWDEGRACEARCTAPCNACDLACGGTCDVCKADCAPGSEGCARACAEARASCRATCLETEGTCLSACPAEERKCNADFEAKVAERCPDCAEIGECLMDNEEYGEEHPACSKQFPRVDEVCFEWCYPS